MVELRHYCNLISKEISRAARDGSLTFIQSKNSTPQPSIEELKKQFPTLTSKEIQEILSSNPSYEGTEELPTPPSFVKGSQAGAQIKLQNKETAAANAKSFSDLLKSAT